jgi:hypothetical protein
LGGDRPDDAGCDLILELKDVVELPHESFGPKLRSGQRIDELSRDINPAFGPADAALGELAHAELGPPGPPLVGEARVAAGEQQMLAIARILRTGASSERKWLPRGVFKPF